MADETNIHIEVAYAKPEQQVVIRLTLPLGGTAQDAIAASDLLQQFPEIDLTTQKIGIYSQICKPDKALEDGDRVEIYRPLAQDPMTARRNRMQK